MLLYFYNTTCAYNHPSHLCQKSVPLLKSTFISLFHTYLFSKSSLQNSLTLPSSLISNFSPSYFLRTAIPTICTKIFSLLQSFRQFRLSQESRVLGKLMRTDTVLISHFYSKYGSDNRAYNHWLFIAVAHKIGLLQVINMTKISDEDACNSNGKLSNSPSLIPSTYCHYFHTLLAPSQEHTFSWKPVASLKFSILLYYSCPSSPICLEKIFSYSPIKIGSITLLLHFGIRPQHKPSNPKDPYTKTK